jgi:hypothetical protein
MTKSEMLLLYCALALGVAHAKTSTSDNVSSRLMVYVSLRGAWILFLPLLSDPQRPRLKIPQSLYKEDGYDHREALFGTPPYGGSIAQNVYYSGSTLCETVVDNTAGFPHRADKDGKPQPWQSPFILMVDRGGCTFVEKVSGRQRQEATMERIYRLNIVLLAVRSVGLNMLELPEF